MRRRENSLTLTRRLFVIRLSQKGFPPFPWIVTRILIPLKFSRNYKECWKYGKYPKQIDLW